MKLRRITPVALWLLLFVFPPAPPVANVGAEGAPAGKSAPIAKAVSIRRDTYGVPHILASTEEAAAFGMGYAQAEDHPEELIRRLIAARGEEARYLGSGLESDFRTRRFRGYEMSRANFRRLSPLFQRILHSFAGGVNYYVEKHRERLPSWVPHFDGIDVLARGRAEIIRFALKEEMFEALRERYPGRGGEEAARGLVAPRDSVPASNMWALSGSRTRSGSPILMSNPHQAWTSLYWEAQATVPGKINFFGGTFIGRPVLQAGFNERCGWTQTVNYPDLDDIYLLKRAPGRGRQYVFGGKRRPLIRHEVTVQVSNGTAVAPKTRTFWDSHLGPIVHETREHFFALKSTVLDEYRSLEQWYEMSKARNLQEFTAALRTQSIPMFNITYADVDGNIAYFWNASVPRRPAGRQYGVEVTAQDEQQTWKAVHPFADLPQLLNPYGGYVQNSNGPPWYTSLAATIDPAKFPSYFEPVGPLSFRAQRGLQLIQRKERFSIEDVIEAKYDTRLLLAERVKSDLLAAARALATGNEELHAALTVLENWDNRVAAESQGAILFLRFWDTYSRSVRQPFAVQWDLRRPTDTPFGLGDPDEAVKHLAEAVRWTRRTYGSESVPWGDVHRIRIGPVNLPASGAGRAYGPFSVMEPIQASDGKQVVGQTGAGREYDGYGDAWIFIVQFSRPLVAYSLVAYGQTRNPQSPHSTDQVRLLAERKLRPVWFTEQAIKANLECEYSPGEEAGCEAAQRAK